MTIKIKNREIVLGGVLASLAIAFMPLYTLEHFEKMAVDVVTSRKVSRHHGRSTGRTHSAGHGKPRKVRAFSCQPINVGSLDIRMPVAAQVTPADVVDQHEHDIRFVSHCLSPLPLRLLLLRFLLRPHPPHRIGCPSTIR